MSTKVALTTGVTGQDGSNLAEFLFDKGYEAGELGITIRWEGKGVDEVGCDQHGKGVVRVDPPYFRPADVECVLGEPTHVHAKRGWRPRVSFAELVGKMVREDLRIVGRDSLITQHGYRPMAYNE